MKFFTNFKNKDKAINNDTNNDRYKLFFIYLAMLILSCILFALKYNDKVINFLMENTSLSKEILIDILKTLSSGLFCSVLLGMIFEYMLRKETSKSTIKDFTRQLNKMLPGVIIDSIIYNKELQKDFISEEKIDEIICNCLTKKVGDDNIAQSLWKALDKTLFSYDKKIEDLNVNTYVEYDKDNDKCDESIVHFTKEVTYKEVLTKSNFTFLIVDKESKIYKYLKNYDNVHFFNKIFEIDEENPYIEIEIKINDVKLQLKEKLINNRTALFNYSNSFLNNLIGEKVTISYEIKTYIDKYTPYYTHQFLYPCKGFKFNFITYNTGLKDIRVLSNLISEDKPNVSLHSRNDMNSLTVTLNDWVFPKSCVNFLWKFENEEKTENIVDSSTSNPN